MEEVLREGNLQGSVGEERRAREENFLGSVEEGEGRETDLKEEEEGWTGEAKLHRMQEQFFEREGKEEVGDEG